MRLTRSTLGRLSLISAAVGTLIATVLIGQTAATAKPEPTSLDVAGAAATLAAQLGDRTAGSYQDASGALVVTITDPAAADQVRRSGAIPRLVSRTGAQLEATMAELNRSATITGTAWAVDPAANQVVVSIDTSVTAANLTRLNAVIDRLGNAVRVEYVAGVLSTTISGGDAIYGGSSRCSLGFNVRSNNTGLYYFLTAGHCTNIASNWYADSSHTQLIGPRVVTSFPGNDYGIVRYDTSISHPGTVGSQDITSAGTPVINQTVYRRGSTTGTHSGHVTALNATVNYAQGTVTGLIKTTVCAEPGDSGGSLYAGTTAYGLTSGGSGNCTTGGTTYFQPVVEPLNNYGLAVY